MRKFNSDCFVGSQWWTIATNSGPLYQLFQEPPSPWTSLQCSLLPCWKVAVVVAAVEVAVAVAVMAFLEVIVVVVLNHGRPRTYWNWEMQLVDPQPAPTLGIQKRCLLSGHLSWGHPCGGEREGSPCPRAPPAALWVILVLQELLVIDLFGVF